MFGNNDRLRRRKDRPPFRLAGQGGETDGSALTPGTPGRPDQLEELRAVEVRLLQLEREQGESLAQYEQLIEELEAALRRVEVNQQAFDERRQQQDFSEADGQRLTKLEQNLQGIRQRTLDQLDLMRKPAGEIAQQLAEVRVELQENREAQSSSARGASDGGPY